MPSQCVNSVQDYLWNTSLPRMSLLSYPISAAHLVPQYLLELFDISIYRNDTGCKHDYKYLLKPSSYKHWKSRSISYVVQSRFDFSDIELRFDEKSAVLMSLEDIWRYWWGVNANPIITKSNIKEQILTRGIDIASRSTIPNIPVLYEFSSLIKIQSCLSHYFNILLIGHDHLTEQLCLQFTLIL